ncbi:hypothetical protein GGR56DRAFT_637547 [Xylariaceae sp. FL0804]|nr:hypothetical protein GGR56DRAFT_637547 [Xylariaceae sp. FL0804]
MFKMIAEAGHSVASARWSNIRGASAFTQCPCCRGCAIFSSSEIVGTNPDRMKEPSAALGEEPKISVLVRTGTGSRRTLLIAVAHPLSTVSPHFVMRFIREHSYEVSSIPKKKFASSPACCQQHGEAAGTVPGTPYCTSLGMFCGEDPHMREAPAPLGTSICTGSQTGIECLIRKNTDNQAPKQSNNQMSFVGESIDGYSV